MLPIVYLPFDRSSFGGNHQGLDFRGSHRSGRKHPQKGVLTLNLTLHCERCASLNFRQLQNDLIGGIFSRRDRLPLQGQTRKSGRRKNLKLSPVSHLNVSQLGRLNDFDSSPVYEDRSFPHRMMPIDRNSSHDVPASREIEIIPRNNQLSLITVHRGHKDRCVSRNNGLQGQLVVTANSVIDL